MEQLILQVRSHRTVKNNKLLFKNRPTQSVQTYSTVVANTGCLPASVVAAGVTLIQLKTIVFVPAHVEQRNAKRSLPCQDTPEAKYLVIPQHPDCDIKCKRETMRWKRSCLPPNCVYACLMSHRAVTSCSQGIGSWYWSKYLKKNKTGYNTQHRKKESLINVRFLPESHLCAISRSSFVSTFASDVIPATLQAMSL